jgi:hypothetical protein
MNEVKLIVGDLSGDGHEKTKTIIVSVNKTEKELNGAYKKSHKLTGIDFSETCCCDYEEYYISKTVYDSVVKHFSETTGKKWKELYSRSDDDDYDNGVVEDSEMFAELYLEFIQLSLPDLVWEFVGDRIPEINIGGYGLFR